jgi:hypothetical protein
MESSHLLAHFLKIGAELVQLGVQFAEFGFPAFGGGLNRPRGWCLFPAPGEFLGQSFRGVVQASGVQVLHRNFHVMHSTFHVLKV